MKRRILSIILTLAMCLSLLPAMTLTAAAASSVKYRTCDENGQNWQTASRSVYTAVTSSQTQWNGGWYVADRSVAITGKTVTVIGDVHLILKDGCTLTITGASGGSGSNGGGGGGGSVGISVLSGSSLTIYGQTGQSGKLKVIGGDGGDGGSNEGANGGSGGDGGIAVNGSITIYGGNVIVNGGKGGKGGPAASGGKGGSGGSGGIAVTGRVTAYGGSAAFTGGSGGQGASTDGIGRGVSGGDGKAINGGVNFAAGYIHLTRAGSDEDTVEAMEWTGGSNSFPQETKWVKIQPMPVNGLTVTPAAAKVKPGGTVNFTAKVMVLNPSDVGSLNVTRGAEWTVSGGKGYTMTDGTLTVRANETTKTLTVTVKYGSNTSTATVEVEQAASPEQLVGVENVGDTMVALPSGGTATRGQDGTVTVPGGTIVIPPAGPSITVSSTAVVDENGSVTLSGGGSATVSGTTVTVSANGGTITPNADNTVSVPAGSRIITKSGKRAAVPPQGGTISRDGVYEDNPKPVFNEGPTVYPPTVSKPVNGEVSVSPRSPRKGDTVTITPTPSGNYEVGNVSVKVPSGGKLEVTDNHDGTYSFTQPGETVTVEAAFAPRTQTMPFFDVWPGDWCYDAVCYVNSRGIMGGYSNGFFQPNIQFSRAMLAQVLYNLAGGPGVNYQTRYNDVPADAWYAGAVRWAASEGIITGYGDGSFRPGAPITREQFAVMLYRFEQSRGGGFAGQHAFRLDYADAESIGAYAREAAAWCTMNGILGGYGDNTLRPRGQTTRAQAAAMLMRFCERN